MKAGTKRARANDRKTTPERSARARVNVKRKAPVAARAGRRPLPRHIVDVMTSNPICVETGASLHDVARLLDEYEISGLPVVDDQDQLVGVISRSDLLRRMLEGPPEARHDEHWLDLLAADSPSSVDIDVARLGGVDDLMSIDPVVAKAGETIATVARRMAEERVHRVVVVDGRRPIGIVTTLDLLKFFPA